MQQRADIWFNFEVTNTNSSTLFLNEGLSEFYSNLYLNSKIYEDVFDLNNIKFYLFKDLFNLRDNKFNVINEIERFNVIKRDIDNDTRPLFIEHSCSEEAYIFNNDEISLLKGKFLINQLYISMKLNNNSLDKFVKNCFIDNSFSTFNNVFNYKNKNLNNSIINSINVFKLCSLIPGILQFKVETYKDLIQFNNINFKELTTNYNNFKYNSNFSEIFDNNELLIDVDLLIIDINNNCYNVMYKLNLKEDKQVLKYDTIINNAISDSLSININTIKCIIPNSLNSNYILFYYDIDTLNYIINEIDIISLINVNRNSNMLNILSYLPVKLINDLFYFVLKNKLDSIHFVAFTKRMILLSLKDIKTNVSINNKYLNSNIAVLKETVNFMHSTILNHYLSLTIHAIKNYFYENHQSSFCKFFYKLISEKLYTKDCYKNIKSILLNYMLDLININSSEEIKYLIFLIFKGEEIVDDKSFESNSIDNNTITNTIDVKESSSLNTTDKNSNKYLFGKYSEFVNYNRSTIFKLFSVIFESTIITRYEKSYLEANRFSNNVDNILNKVFDFMFTNDMILYLKTSVPDMKIKQELLDSFEVDYYKDNKLSELLMKSVNKRNHYFRMLKPYSKSKFFNSFYYVLSNYSNNYCLMYYLCMNPSKTVSLRILEKYDKLRVKLQRGNYNQNIELAFNYERDFKELQKKIIISNSSNDLVLKDSEI